MHTDRQSLIRDVTRLARRTPGPLKCVDFCRAARLSPTVLRTHARGWTRLLAEAGLSERAGYRWGVSNEVLLAEFDRIATRLGRAPTSREIRGHSRFRDAIYRRRFGSARGLAAAYAAWRRAQGRPAIPRFHRHARGSPVYGDPFAFRGLTTAPVNEMAVVHLFGALAQDLGFAVLRYRSDFPDCEALRRGPDGHWRQVRIEFEHRSSNFARHKHDAAQRDVIVCWLHDWSDCPLEVIDLESSPAIPDALRARPPEGPPHVSARHNTPG
jgi:Homing endonuclease associated repeat